MTFTRACCCDCTYITPSNLVGCLRYNFPAVATKAAHCDVAGDPTCDCEDETDWSKWTCYRDTLPGWSGICETNGAWEEILAPRTITNFDQGYEFPLIKTMFSLDSHEQSTWCCPDPVYITASLSDQIGEYATKRTYKGCYDCPPLWDAGDITKIGQTQISGLELSSTLTTNYPATTYHLKIKSKYGVCVCDEDYAGTFSASCGSTTWEWYYTFPVVDCLRSKSSADADVTLAGVSNSFSATRVLASTIPKMVEVCGFDSTDTILSFLIPFGNEATSTSWSRGVYALEPEPTWRLDGVPC